MSTTRRVFFNLGKFENIRERMRCVEIANSNIKCETMILRDKHYLINANESVSILQMSNKELKAWLKR